MKTVKRTARPYTEEDARRTAADDAIRAAADALADLERDVASRRANAAADAEARKRALQAGAYTRPLLSST
jgi:hypothetical protein